MADEPEKARPSEEKAAGEFTPLGPSQVEGARQEVWRAVEALEARLAQDAENGPKWRKYLRLDGLRSELKGRKAANLENLDDVYTRLNRDAEGLDLFWFVDLRLALGRYLNVARAIDNPEIEAAYKELVEKTLPAQLEAFKADPSPAAAHDLGYALGWLSDFRQAEQWVRQLRRQYARPNVFVEVSRDYVTSAVGGPVDETAPIHDVILGTSVHGTGRTKGQITVALIPCKDKAVVETVLAGTTYSDNTGYNGPVSIFSTGVTQFEGRNRMVVTGEGIEVVPATSEATTSTTINGICSHRGRRLVERAAWRRACQQKPMAEAIAAQHAEWRVNRRMDERTSKAADDANGRYEERLRGPLRERKAFAEQVTCSTTRSALRVRALRAAYNQLAAPGDPPALGEPADVAMRVHQSVVNNTAVTLLAGHVVTEEEFLKTVEDMLGEVPENLRPEEGKAAWVIHFADREPFTITFADGGYTVSLHAVGYEREGKEYPGMNIAAAYKIEKSDEGLVAIRQGELEVYPPGFVKGERQLTGREQTLREMLRKRFAKVFDEKYVPQQYLEPKGRLKKAGRVPLSQWTASDGWMIMAWKVASEPKEPAPEKK